jgi:hypothetical protein
VKYGQSCSAGYEGKINAVYECGKSGGNIDSGAKLLGQIVGDSFGLEPQYYAKVGYTALRDAVNAVGGITVKIDSSDPRGIYDPNFDWQCGFKCKMVKWPNGDAQLDREQYQQKIILAIKQKAISAGALANPVTLNKLIDTVGSNIKTSVDASEIQTLVGLVRDIKPESIRQISLIDEKSAVVTTGNVDGQSVVRPVAGIYDFSKIKAYVAAQISGDTFATEGATITVLNAGDTLGAASKRVSLLAEAGVTATAGDATTTATIKELQWYDLSKGKMPGTTKKLAKVLAMPSSGTKLPAGVQSDADFVILIGNGSN